MGSKCDFYVGRGLDAVYRGSIGHDALAVQLAEYFEGVHDRAEFERRLATVYQAYGEIPASHGWPWPWNDSHMTDIAVAFDAGEVWVSHPSKNWALLAKSEEPTAVPCVFPNMGAKARATPEGRLRQHLRYTAFWSSSLDYDVILGLLAYAAYLLAKQFLHVFEKDGHYWVPRIFWDGHDPDTHKLQHLVTALRTSEELDALLSARKAAHNEPEWDLLTWLRDTGAEFSGKEVEITLDAKQPVYFGHPLGVKALESFGRPIAYVQLENTDQLEPGLVILEQVLNRIGTHYAALLANEVLDLGCLPVPLKEVEAWMDKPQAALGGRALRKNCDTVKARRQSRLFAAKLVGGEFVSQTVEPV